MIETQGSQLIRTDGLSQIQDAQWLGLPSEHAAYATLWMPFSACGENRNSGMSHGALSVHARSIVNTVGNANGTRTRNESKCSMAIAQFRAKEQESRVDGEPSCPAGG
jgi:hypothetical protein